MARRLTCVTLTFCCAVGLWTQTAAARRATSPKLDQFLSLDDPDPWQYRALRHLEARNDHFDMSASMNVWTEADRSGFRYRIVAEEGAERIRNRVFRATLEREREMWTSDAAERASLTPANYEFEERGLSADGLSLFAVKPRRKDVLLVDGSIFLSANDGDLVRVEGQLSKPPSFWTRHVDIVRWYKRLNGVRMPVALDSVANVRIAGKSTFRMTYDYESVNGQQVGSPRGTLH